MVALKNVQAIRVVVGSRRWATGTSSELFSTTPPRRSFGRSLDRTVTVVSPGWLLWPVRSCGLSVAATVPFRFCHGAKSPTAAPDHSIMGWGRTSSNQDETASTCPAPIPSSCSRGARRPLPLCRPHFSRGRWTWKRPWPGALQSVASAQLSLCSDFCSLLMRQSKPPSVYCLLKYAWIIGSIPSDPEGLHLLVSEDL